MLTTCPSQNAQLRLNHASLWGGLKHAAGYLVGVTTALRHRREIAQLLEAEPGVLRDLGLHPADVQAALAEPLWRDPSGHLLASAGERRHAARSALRDNLQGLFKSRIAETINDSRSQMEWPKQGSA